MFTARTIGAEEALAIGLATDRGRRACRRRRWRRCASGSPATAVTLRATKEALRRLRAAGMPDGNDLVREAYASEDFRRTVEAFLAKGRS